MKETTSIKAPGACSEAELRQFEQLVRRGFAGSDADLPGRIRKARQLGMRAKDSAMPTAIAALKQPGEEYRAALFEKAGVSGDPDAHALELGWVYVVPELRRRHVAHDLCRTLMAPVTGAGVLATTRPDNLPMIRILRDIGFERAGKPFPHVRRDEELALFLRP